MKNPSQIRNKSKRQEIYAKYKQQKKKIKRKLRDEKVKEVEELGEAAPPKQIPTTIENTRILDETYIKEFDDEIIADEKDDEFALYYNDPIQENTSMNIDEEGSPEGQVVAEKKKPKIMITTRPNCSRKLYPFIGDLMQMIPNAFYYPRGKLLVNEMASFATKKGFTHIVVLSEKNKQCDG